MVGIAASYNITRGLAVAIGGSYIDAVLSSDAPSLNASKGARLPGSPKANANFSLVYNFDVSGHRTYVRGVRGPAHCWTEVFWYLRPSERCESMNGPVSPVRRH